MYKPVTVHVFEGTERRGPRRAGQEMAGPCRWASRRAVVTARRPSLGCSRIHSGLPAARVHLGPPIRRKGRRAMSRASSSASTETSDDVIVISAGPVGQSVADRARARVEGCMTRGRARWFPVGSPFGGHRLVRVRRSTG